MTDMLNLIEGIAVALGIGVVVLNAYATWRVSRDELSEKIQKVTYLVLIWLLPLIGSIVVLYQVRSEEKYEARHYEPSGPPQWWGD